MSGQAERHKEYSLTFRQLTPTSSIKFTLDPLNIRTIWATGFLEWGVEPTRIKILGTFCGRGIVTVDGPLWEKARDLLRPHFFGKPAAPISLDVLEV
jgi:hypothetical protein